LLRQIGTVEIKKAKRYQNAYWSYLSINNMIKTFREDIGYP